LTIKLTQPDSSNRIDKSTVRDLVERDLTVAHLHLARQCVQASSPFPHCATLEQNLRFAPCGT